MEKDIVDGKIGAVGSYDVEFKSGKLQLKVGVEHSGLGADVALWADADKVLDALAKAIPGVLDDAVIEVAKKAIKLL